MLTYVPLEVMVEDNIKGTMFVFIFVCGIGLENWSDNARVIKILHQPSSVIHKTDNSHSTKETVKDREDGHSFTVLFIALQR